VSASYRFHRFAAFVVLIGAAAWVLTGEFSSVGGAEQPAATDSPAPQAAAAETLAPAAPVLRTVAVLVPAFIDHARTIRLSGTTEPDKRAVLAARADGVINDLALIKGAAITEGTMVMALEGPETLAQAEIATIALAQRDRELGVAERLFSGGNTPEIQRTSAQSARDAAQAELNRARAAVDRLQLKAPFGGIVETVDVELGEWVQTGAPVATILSLDPIVVKAEVSEIDVGSVAPGSKASVRLVNGNTMEGTVRLVAREATAQTRTFPVEIMLPNPDSALPSGMTAEVEILAAPQRATIVPRSVILLDDTGKIGVRGIGADDVAHFVPVTILDDTENGLVITGVPEGFRIIVAGQELVSDGEKVAVAPIEGPTQ
jgi:multidrug efflux system membrane fusion protein